MDDKLLIEAVRRNSVLYDLAHPKYMDNKNKNKIWNDIGRQLNADGTTCRSRWCNIRDQYRKSIRKAEESKNSRTVKYKYYEQLSFLNDYFQEKRKNRKSTSDTQGDEDPLVYNNDTQGSTSTDYSNPESTVGKSSQDATLHEVLTLPGAQPQFHHATHSSESPMSSSIPLFLASTSTDTVGNNQAFQLNSAAASIMEYIIKKSEANNEHPIDKFLEGIAPTLKSLTGYYQNLAKSEIFNVVQKYEMQMLSAHHDIKPSN